MAGIDNGTPVVMKRQHPHSGKKGYVRAQPSPSGVSGMYLIEFDGPYEGNAYAFPDEFTVMEDD